MPDSPPVRHDELKLIVQLIQRNQEALERRLDDGFAGINTRLDTLNSKTADHEKRVVALETSAGRITLSTLFTVFGLILSALAIYVAIA